MPTTAPKRGPFRPEDIIYGATPEDNVRRELIDGWLYIDGQPASDPMADVAADSANPRHQTVVLELAYLLRGYAADHPGRPFVSPMDCLLHGSVLQPDVLYLDHDDPVGHPIETVPALVIEVSSPSTRRHDLVRKRRVYEQAGVPEYWFVDLDGLRFERHTLTGAGSYGPPEVVEKGALASTALVGLGIDVEAVLALALYGEQ